MSDEDRVVVADCLWPHEAGMLKSVLDAAGVDAAVKGALSTSGEIPAPAASVSVRIIDEEVARVALLGIEADGELFTCPLCNESAPPGFSECPMCTEMVTTEEVTERPVKSGGVIFVAIIVAVFLLYWVARVLPKIF
jgi:hypothetical protein